MSQVEKSFLNPVTVAIERIGELPDSIYMLSLEFKDKEPVTMESPFICGNIFINGKVKMGFDAPATFEVYYDCEIEKVDVMRGTNKEDLYLDIFVKA